MARFVFFSKVQLIKITFKFDSADIKKKATQQTDSDSISCDENFFPLKKGNGERDFFVDKKLFFNKKKIEMIFAPCGNCAVITFAINKINFANVLIRQLCKDDACAIYKSR